MRIRSRTLAICTTLALLLGTPLFADEPKKGSEDKPAQKAEKSDEKNAKKPANAKQAKAKVDKVKEGSDEPIVFTNGDLEALFGKAEPSAPPPSAAPALGVPAAKATGVAPSPAADENKQRMQQIQAEIKRLTEMNRSLRNPLLARVPQTDEEKKSFEGKGADERIRMNNERIAELRKEMAKLQSAPAGAQKAGQKPATR